MDNPAKDATKKKPSGDIVLVNLRAEQKFKFDQTIKMTREEWADFKSLDSHEAAVRVGDFLDAKDPFDWDDVEDDFEAAIVDKNGDRIKPIDQYGGGD